MPTARAETYTLSTSKAFALHSLCVLALASAFWIARNVHASNLISNPTQTLRLLWAIESPIVIFGYSFLRRNPDHCSFYFAGALLNAFGAFILGAPIRIEYLTKTINWSLLMSLFTFVPAASVFGSSWKDWQRLFAHSKPIGGVDYMISLPAHGAVIGAWFGAWPMPLDWERPWQDWPICVSYGAIAGYLFGTLASLMFVHVIGRRQHIKGD
ncbi:uncharacterized protein LOC131230339 isoform X2 [Magnolia sinica]|uniref:uncharacterized protein LOC131230339 isoform X2 n=1 Tax=Magnolia sinica TaxID=86752 RepID=UPI002657C1EE|nr:uncharacterized protein LOC131230339 isoform X2 [Magnolia sinica]